MLRIMLIFLSLFSVTVQALPVFPGAEGFGTQTPGGRDGVVCKVTTLDDDGKGSLCECVDLDQPRIVIFAVAGTITLKTNLTITHPFISIYGQTAPGDGVMITGAPSILREPFTIATHDVVIQHVRFRAGTADAKNCCRNALTILGAADKTDGKQTYNVVLDHCSFSWGTHEILSTWFDVHDITISNSIIGPGLYNASNTDGPAGTGVMLGSKGAHAISFHHNLLVHSQAQNPKIQTDGGIIDVVNNLIYNWGSGATNIHSDSGAMQINLVQNLYINGENSAEAVPELIATNEGQKTRMYLEENLCVRDATQPEPLPIDLAIEGWDKQNNWEKTERFAAPAISTFKAQVLKKKLLDNVGATLPKLDRIDRQAINDVKHGTGFIPHCVDAKDRVWIMSCEKNAGGWPRYSPGIPANDRDNDGIPDQWESDNNMNPDRADSTKDYNANGYMNIEEWIFSLTPAPKTTSLSKS